MSVWTMLGGPVFWMLVALGAAGGLVFLNRLVWIRRAQIDYADFLRGVGNVLEQNNPDEAIALCDETPAPVARIVAAAIRHRASSARILRDIVDSAGRAEVGRFERRLATLAIIAQSAPLLGLLGTVIGMMKVVLSVNGEALVTRVDLVGGAMQALGATAAGIAVAVCVQVMYSVLRVRFDRLTADLEAAASEILGMLAANRETAA